MPTNAARDRRIVWKEEAGQEDTSYLDQASMDQDQEDTRHLDGGSIDQEYIDLRHF